MRRLAITMFLCLVATSGAQGQGIPFPLPPIGGGGPNTLDLTIADATSDLGVPFQMVISADSVGIASQASFTLNVAPADILITGWNPGAGLAAYLAANGPIGCDDSNTGSALNAFFFFGVPYDAAVYGDEFVVVDCLAIAQQVGTSTATLTDTMSGLVSTATVNFPGGTPIDPSQIPQPPQPPLPVPMGFGDYTIADATATIGQPVSLPVDVTSTMPLVLTMFTVTVDPTQLSISSIDPGAGLSAYIAANGPIPCDITMGGSQAVVFMLFLVPFDTALYGTDFVNITCDVVATTPGSTQVTVLNDVGQASIADVTIAAAGDSFLRGDSNLDGACNIADAINMLNFLFNNGPMLCMDAGDMNDDGGVNIADPLALLLSMFGGGPPIVETCGPDLSPDTLDCQVTGC
ncbi:MAG: hypothetical protein AAF581_03035 [Planctomycetota bacterium]